MISLSSSIVLYERYVALPQVWDLVSAEITYCLHLSENIASTADNRFNFESKLTGDLQVYIKSS